MSRDAKDGFRLWDRPPDRRPGAGVFAIRQRVHRIPVAKEDCGHSFVHITIISGYDDNAVTLALDFPDLRTLVYRLVGHFFRNGH